MTSGHFTQPGETKNTFITPQSGPPGGAHSSALPHTFYPQQGPDAFPASAVAESGGGRVCAPYWTSGGNEDLEGTFSPALRT